MSMLDAVAKLACVGSLSLSVVLHNSIDIEELECRSACCLAFRSSAQRQSRPKNGWF